jgi:hypothetical protein
LTSALLALYKCTSPKFVTRLLLLDLSDGTYFTHYTKISYFITFERPLLQIIVNRLKEPLPKIQVLSSARQVGKTTLSLQALLMGFNMDSRLRGNDNFSSGNSCLLLISLEVL